MRSLPGWAEEPARKWEPKRLRHRIFQAAATIADHARQQILHLSDHMPWAGVIETGYAPLCGLPALAR